MSGVYIGVGGKARKVKGGYIGIDGKARKIKKGYIGDENGVARLAWSSEKKLSEYTEGSTVYLNESGTPVSFYVAKHNYEPDLNGEGRTLLVRATPHSSRKWSEYGTNTYATSTLSSWLNGEYKNSLDDGIQDEIGTTTFYYTESGNSNVVTTLSRSIFLPSATECGIPQGNFNIEGSTIPTLRNIIPSSPKSSKEQPWTRTPGTGNTNAVCALASTSAVGHLYPHTNECAVVPCFTLPEWVIFDDNDNIIL